ncbi:MAG: hypothetical protein ACT4NK_14140 [Limnobacter sp.]|uniref:hypothetical protein n=1 Tax=Limnobacter sp. TaxID=2003368 RepID=UPI004037DF09
MHPKRDLKVIDTQKPIVQNYWKIVFFREPKRVAPAISRFKWTWLCIFEVLFGQELLESLVTTASVSGCPEDPDLQRLWGRAAQLNLHIPSGIFTNIVRAQLVEVLYYKYYLQYLFIKPVADIHCFDNETIDLTRTRFRLNKELLYLVIPFRRTYLATALGVNLAADLAVYLATSSPTAVAVAAASIEACRRLLKL